MNQKAKDYILNKYGEETLKGVENGTILINDTGLNGLMPRRKFKIPVGNLSDDEVNSLIDKFQPKPISEDFFIPVKEDPTDYYYRFDFNLKVGDIVKFAEGAFDECNKMMYNTANPKLAVKQGVVTDVDCVVSSFLNGSSWACKVDFDGEIIELLCGFFEKI